MTTMRASRAYGEVYVTYSFIEVSRVRVRVSCLTPEKTRESATVLPMKKQLKQRPKDPRFELLPIV